MLKHYECQVGSFDTTPIETRARRARPSSSAESAGSTKHCNCSLKILAMLFAVSSMFMGGCCSTRRVADPKVISLSNALVSVTQSLQAMRMEGRQEDPFGLYPSEVEVTFNLSASQENSSELKVDLSAPTGSPITAGLGGAVGSKATEIRGNQITIKFSNLLDANPETTLVGKQNTNVIKLINALQKAGGVPTR